jgi:hypothetical protein
MQHARHTHLSPFVLALVLAACGGGDLPDPGTPQASAGAEPRSIDALAISNADRVSATTATAQSETNACAVIKPFYWEIGNSKDRLASGSIAGPNSATKYAATTQMAIASASKWIYGAFVVQRSGGVLTDMDHKYLTMQSGYVNMQDCVLGQTVDGCLNYQGNGSYTAGSDGKFFYNNGHMQEHASLTGLGDLNSKSLAAAVRAQIGTDIKIGYTWPQVAGGVVTSADAYGRFLRKILDGRLAIGALLGSRPVCTNPTSCGRAEAQFTPTPPGETLHYSIGHWVEDDPIVGDGAFSSAGSYGFYPWIDAKKTTYGIIARQGSQNSGDDSAMCGRLLRKAWATGRAL